MALGCGCGKRVNQAFVARCRAALGCLRPLQCRGRCIHDRLAQIHSATGDGDYGRHAQQGQQYTSLGLHPEGRDDGDADTMMGDNGGNVSYADLSRLSAPTQRPPRRVSFSLDHEQQGPSQGQRADQGRGFPKIERDAPYRPESG